MKKRHAVQSADTRYSERKQQSINLQNAIMEGHIPKNFICRDVALMA